MSAPARSILANTHRLAAGHLAGAAEAVDHGGAAAFGVVLAFTLAVAFAIAVVCADLAAVRGGADAKVHLRLAVGAEVAAHCLALVLVEIPIARPRGRRCGLFGHRRRRCALLRP